MACPASVLNGDGLSVQELREALAQTQHALAAAQRQLCEQAQILQSMEGLEWAGYGGRPAAAEPIGSGSHCHERRSRWPTSRRADLIGRVATGRAAPGC